MQTVNVKRQRILFRDALAGLRQEIDGSWQVCRSAAHLVGARIKAVDLSPDERLALSKKRERIPALEVLAFRIHRDPSHVSRQGKAWVTLMELGYRYRHKDCRQQVGLEGRLNRIDKPINLVGLAKEGLLSWSHFARVGEWMRSQDLTEDVAYELLCQAADEGLSVRDMANILMLPGNEFRPLWARKFAGALRTLGEVQWDTYAPPELRIAVREFTEKYKAYMIE